MFKLGEKDTRTQCTYGAQFNTTCSTSDRLLLRGDIIQRTDMDQV